MNQTGAEEVGAAESEIKSMKLYEHVDRIYNELKEIGLSVNDPLNVDDVSKFDQYHYFGISAIDEAIDRLKIKCGHTVLDVGSGLGGPARYIASRCQCHVVAVELQEDLHRTAVDLTERCGLADNVRHLHANFITDNIGLDQVDTLVSWLVFLHIKEKAKLFQNCRAALKQGGKIYIEDLHVRGDITPVEAEICETLYFSLETKEKYIKHLTDAGFIDIKFDDVTDAWAPFVKERAEKYRATRERHVRVHGEEIYTAQQAFFDAMNTLFQGGHIRGCCIIATAN